MSKNNTIMLFAMVLILASSTGYAMYTHELNHVFINKRVGIESHIDFINYFPAIATVRTSPQTKDLSNFELAQSFNESVNYNLAPFFMGIMGLMITGIIYLGDKK